jgi:butyrate kinase
MKDQLILAINPGSTSTKVTVYAGNQQNFLKTIKHTTEEVLGFARITDQYEFRKQIILDELQLAGVKTENILVVVGRGGLLKPIPSGVYEVNDRMIEDLREGVLGQHASNLGGLIAHDIAKSLPSARAYIADPVVVDEMDPIARISGHPLFERMSIFHALNQKAIARSYATLRNTDIAELNLIIAHMGGGVSVGAHVKGRVVDVNQALDGDGPFSPERSGTLPVGSIIKACFSGEYTMEEMKKMVTGKGGFVAYLGTNDAMSIEHRAHEGDEYAALIQDAFTYQVAKEIGAMATVMKGEVDAILLTGGIAYGKPVVNKIRQRVEFIAPVYVYPGEDEMKALAMNGYMVLKGEVEAKEYL